MITEREETVAIEPEATTPAARRRDPFSVIPEVEMAMERMLGRWPFFRSLPRLGDIGEGWAPQVDVFEQGDDLVVKAELPGVAREDIEVSVDHGDLVLKGERKSEHEVKDEHYYRMERSFGSFYRRLPLPEGVDEEAINATFTDGVLEIRTPKPSPEQPKGKKITIA